MIFVATAARRTCAASPTRSFITLEDSVSPIQKMMLQDEAPKMIPEIEKTVEVKRDKHTDRTGNVFIETYCNKVESGINISTADYWAYLTKTMLYWIKSIDLKLCILENEIPEGKNYMIDGKIIDAYLIPVDIFKTYCMRIDTLTEEQLCQLN